MGDGHYQVSSKTIPLVAEPPSSANRVADGYGSVKIDAARAARQGRNSHMTFYGNKELADSFRTVRKNTLAIAEDIPEDKYGFRPAPDSRSVAELLRHIAVTTSSHFDMYADKKMTSFVGFDWGAYMQQTQQAEQRLETKAQIVDALRSSGDQWASYVGSLSDAEQERFITFSNEGVPPGKTRFETILSVKEHEMHHRGQLMVLERMLGIVPHLTRQMQERWSAAAAAAPKAKSVGA